MKLSAFIAFCSVGLLLGFLFVPTAHSDRLNLHKKFANNSSWADTAASAQKKTSVSQSQHEADADPDELDQEDDDSLVQGAYGNNLHYGYSVGLCQGIAIPAYFAPGPLWTAAIDAAPRTVLIIMNPNSGPGSSQNSDYVDAVTAAQAVGIKVLGYVPTTYGQRPMQDVETDIDLYKSWYGVDGIFLDEANSSADLLDYYTTLAKYTRDSRGGFVMLNPGVVPAEEYIRLADNTIVFESSYEDYLQWSPPSWLYKYPAGKFTHLVYGTARHNRLNFAVNLSRHRNAGLIYITDDELDNPWDTLPSYWRREIRTPSPRIH